MSQEKEPRRRFLRQIFAIVPATTLVGGVALGETGCTPATKAATADAASTDAPAVYEPTYFTQAEYAFLNAAVDHLIPSDKFGAGALETNVPQFLDKQMETPYGHGQLWYMQGPFHTDLDATLGYQMNLTPRQIYRHGIAECDGWCQKNHQKVFADVGKTIQESVLKDLEGGKIHFEALPAKTFFAYLLKNTKEGYFADPIYGGNKDMGGWKMVGFPGARADYADWIDQHNVKYPYGPGSISGRKA